MGARQREYPSACAAGPAGRWEARATRSRGALVSKGCSQHPRSWGGTRVLLPFHGRTLELGLHMDLWPCSSPCGRLGSAEPCASRTDSRVELGQGPGCTVEERAEGKGGSAGAEEALLKGQQVWVRALDVKAGGPCPRRRAAVLQRLSQADGAQAELETISLDEARGGGPSALSHL